MVDDFFLSRGGDRRKGRSAASVAGQLVGARRQGRERDGPEAGLHLELALICVQRLWSGRSALRGRARCRRLDKALRRRGLSARCGEGGRGGARGEARVLMPEAGLDRMPRDKLLQGRASRRDAGVVERRREGQAGRLGWSGVKGERGQGQDQGTAASASSKQLPTSTIAPCANPTRPPFPSRPTTGQADDDVALGLAECVSGCRSLPGCQGADRRLVFACATCRDRCRPHGELARPLLVCPAPSLAADLLPRSAGRVSASSSCCSASSSSLTASCSRSATSVPRPSSSSPRFEQLD